MELTEKLGIPFNIVMSHNKWILQYGALMDCICKKYVLSAHTVIE